MSLVFRTLCLLWFTMTNMYGCSVAETYSQRSLKRTVYNAWDIVHTYHRSLDTDLDRTQQVVSLHVEELSRIFAQPIRSRTESQDYENTTIEFNLLQDGLTRCALKQSSIFHENLQNKQPSLILKTGTCNDSREVSLNMQLGVPDSFTATFSVPGSLDWIYVDSFMPKSNLYVVFRKSKASKRKLINDEKIKTPSCHTTKKKNKGNVVTESVYSLNTKDSVERPRQGTIFRIAVIANFAYFRRSGGSKSSTLNAIASVLTRVNGIFVRELGIFLQLIPENDRLLCTKKMKACSKLFPNKKPHVSLRNSKRFIEEIRKIPSSNYDLAQVFTTGSTGLAGIGVLCTKEKSQGVSGQPNPIGDPFAVDYVAHEIGHQLNAGHTFRNCKGRDRSNLQSSEAVEPGSGSTIMSYAGICGETNLQPHSDPYFHSLSLQRISAFITTQLDHEIGCGIRSEQLISPPEIVFPSAPVMQMLPSCRIPIGNYFQLEGKVRTGIVSKQYFYQWDELDPAAGPFKTMVTARFRSYKPTNSSKRFFPNLYFLTYGLHTRKPFKFHEVLPVYPITMRFRFTVRQAYQTGALTSKPTNPIIGGFSFKDMDVHFVSSMSPLLWNEDMRRTVGATGIEVGKQFQFEWKTGDTFFDSPSVIILIALNSFVPVKDKDFDSERFIHDLSWVEVGRVPNTGSATLTVPNISSTFSPIMVNLMIRTTSHLADACFAFDYIAEIPLRHVT